MSQCCSYFAINFENVMRRQMRQPRRDPRRHRQQSGAHRSQSSREHQIIQPVRRWSPAQMAGDD
jgi:hypothetical protein